jgi:hypothetical protein
MEAPLVVAEEALEEEVKEVVLDKYDTIWELNAEASIEAADSIEAEMEAEIAMEEEVVEAEEEIEVEEEFEVEEEMELMAFENHELMPTLVLEEEPAFEDEVEAEMEEEVEVEMEEVHMEEMEEVEEEIFTLNMEAEKKATVVSDFILSKPTNIYVAEADEVEEEMSAPVIASNEVIFEIHESDPSLDMAEDFVLEEIAIEEEVEEEVEEELMEAELMEAEMTIDENIAQEEVATVEMYTAPVVETPAPSEVVFETSFRYEEEPTMQLVMREESNAPVAHVNQQANYDMPLDNAEEQRRKVAERIQKLRNLSFNINNANDPSNDFESVPAYVRRNMEMFGNTLASVENYYSKYTVDKDENNQTQISTINTFMDGKKPD